MAESSHTTTLSQAYKSAQVRSLAPTDILGVLLKENESSVPLSSVQEARILAVVDTRASGRVADNKGLHADVKVVVLAKDGDTARTSTEYLIALETLLPAYSASSSAPSNGLAGDKLGALAGWAGQRAARRATWLGLDTSAAAVGDFVYVSAATAGVPTLTKPSLDAQPIGYVLRVATVGTWVFDPIVAQLKASFTASVGTKKQEGATGDAANTSIAIAGITTSDSIDYVMALSNSAPPAITFPVFTIHSAGNIRSVTNTTGLTLAVHWTDKT